jgi:hypothetical protein
VLARLGVRIEVERASACNGGFGLRVLLRDTEARGLKSPLQAEGPLHQGSSADMPLVEQTQNVAHLARFACATSASFACKVIMV